MRCKLCNTDVSRIFALEESFDTYTLLFQSIMEVSIMDEVCSWCLRIINKIDRFRNQVLIAKQRLTRVLPMQQLHNLQPVIKVEHYDDISSHNYDSCHYDMELVVSKDFEESTDVVKTEHDVPSTPEADTDTFLEPEYNYEEIKEDSEFLEFSKEELLSNIKQSKSYKLILMTDNEIMNENKCKSDELQASDVKYKCLLCVQSFEHEDKYTEHTAEHTIKPYTIQCKFCNIYIRDDKKALLVHYRKHYVRYTCNKCDYKDATLCNVKQHNKSEHTSSKCSMCNETFTCKSMKLRHFYKIHRDNLLECHYCNKPFALKRNIIKHLQWCNTGAGFKCNMCDVVCKTKSDKQYHVDTVHKKLIHQCHICSKVFKSFSILKIHIAIHKNEYFTCNICNRTIKNKVSFDKHKREHERGIYPVACNICHKIYKSEDTYKYHLKNSNCSQNKDNDERKIYKCPICGKEYLCKTNMNRHKAFKHFGVGETCNVCDKKFAHKSTLKLHLKCHVDKSLKPRNFVCDQCGKAFYTKLQVTEHSRIHSDERPIKCDKCSATFKYKSTLFTHTQLIHDKIKRKKKKTT